MENSVKKSQISVIILLVALFALFDLAFYYGITKRYKNFTSPQMQAKSIEISKFLPFDKNSQIYKIKADLNLQGDLPLIDGAAALFPVFSAFVNAIYPKDSVEFDGENFTAKSRLCYTNTRGAYKAIAEGEADLIFVAKPSKAQLEYAEQKGANLKFVPIGLEAFVFIVNKDNPVSDLSVEQVREIYAGKITNWSQVGGKNVRIDAVQRNEGSGSQSAMINFMKNEPMKKNPLSFFGSAIGFSFRYYVETLVANGGVKMLSLNGVYPSVENIKNRSYPVTAEIYAVYDENNKNPNIAKIIEWILSAEGQEIIEKSGYVGVR